MPHEVFLRLSKIYTKNGDQGSTKLASGESVLKSHQRIEAYGTIDELNSIVGVLNEHIKGFEDILGDHASTYQQDLTWIQNCLFDIGGELSFSPEKVFPEVCVIGIKHISRLESGIDQFNKDLPALKNFVLPGGHLINAYAHLARTVTRRAERIIVIMQQSEKVRSELLIFINRLSDWFFVFSRVVSKALKAEEKLWQQDKKR